MSKVPGSGSSARNAAKFRKLIDPDQTAATIGPPPCQPVFRRRLHYGRDLASGGRHGHQTRHHHQELGPDLDLPSQGLGDADLRRRHRRDHEGQNPLPLAGAPRRLDAFDRAHERRRRRRHHGRHEGHEPHPLFQRGHGHGRGRRVASAARQCTEGPGLAALHHHRDRQCDARRHGDGRDQGLILSRRLRPDQLLCDQHEAGDAARRAPRDYRTRASRSDAGAPLVLWIVRHRLRSDHQGAADDCACRPSRLALLERIPRQLSALQGAKATR